MMTKSHHETVPDINICEIIKKCEGPDVQLDFTGVLRSELEDSRSNSLPVRNARMGIFRQIRA